MQNTREHAVDYPIIDCDNHYYEPDDCFTRHIEAKYREHTVWVDRKRRPDGLGVMMLGDERLSFFSTGVSDHVGPPGAMREFFKGTTEEGGHVNLNPIRVQDHPAFTDRKVRLELMDQQQVEACVMLPTLGVGVEYQLRRHPDVLYPSLRAFNRWVADDWGWGQDGRIFSTAVVSLLKVEEAVREVERLLTEGVRILHITAGPIDGKSPADSCYDPFWARVQEAGLIIALHIGETGFNEMYAAPWGEPATPPSHRFTAFNTYVGIGERNITDTAASMLFHNLFGRFPGLRVLAVEFGAAWVPHFVKTIDKVYRVNEHKTRWRYGKPEECPSETFRRHFKVVPFHEDDIEEVAAAIGEEQVINGSDFPHPEGLEWPLQMAEGMGAMSGTAVRNIMRDNACEVLNLAV